MPPPSPLPECPEDAVKILTESLAQLAPQGGPPPRDAALAVFRRHVARVQHQVQELFEAGNMPGLRAGRLLGRLTDGVIAALYRTAMAQSSVPDERLALVATGGYGRGVLAPFSDIDLLFITTDEPSPATLETVEFMLYFLWDLGLKVGHATRSVDECLLDAERDLTIRTSMIDARILAGDADLFASFETRFLAFCRTEGAGAFLAAKQAERDVRHRKF